jgi:hypothetical protein
MKINCSKCGGFLELNRIGLQNYCAPCYNQYRVVNGKKYRYNDEESKKKRLARSSARRALKKGKLNRQPCNVCQNPVTQFHHEDYSKPLEVISLCAQCHVDHHTQKNRGLRATG